MDSSAAMTDTFYLEKVDQIGVCHRGWGPASRQLRQLLRESMLADTKWRLSGRRGKLLAVVGARGYHDGGRKHSAAHRVDANDLLDLLNRRPSLQSG